MCNLVIRALYFWFCWAHDNLLVVIMYWLSVFMNIHHCSFCANEINQFSSACMNCFTVCYMWLKSYFTLVLDFSSFYLQHWLSHLQRSISECCFLIVLRFNFNISFSINDIFLIICYFFLCGKCRSFYEGYRYSSS